MSTRVEAAHGCSIDVAHSTMDPGVWLFTRTMTESNKAIFLPPEAMKQLRKLLK